MLIAAGVAPGFLAEVVAVVCAAAAIAYLSFRAGLLPIVGFLLAGVVVGPHALGLVRDPALVDAAAEAGVILLMFTIGIEFSLDRLSRIKTLIFVGGGLQVGLSVLATMGVLALFGVDWRAGLFTGFLVSLSSTAIVMKVIADRGDTTADYGQASMGLLIFQDLAIIMMVLLVPMIGGGGGGGALEIALAIGKAIGIVLVVLFVARRLMPPVLERVALTCSPELFLLSVVAICFGTAWLTSAAGVSVSLGAFLAGLLVSESRFSHHALGEVMPLQILFSATFFVSVGMLLDLQFVVAHPLLVLSAVGLVLLVKAVTTAGSILALRYPPSVAAVASLTLAQVGEFSFVLDRTGAAVGLTPAGLGPAGSQSLIATTVLLMVATPRLAQLGGRLGEMVIRRQTPSASPTAPGVVHDPFAGVEDHVIVAGYGQAARQLVRVLRGSRVPFVVTTLSPGGANEAESEGVPVLRGDATRQHTLVMAGAERAKMVVVADDDPVTAVRVVATARVLAPTARILVRTRYEADAASLTEAGADLVIADELESVVQIFGEVLRDYRIPAGDIEAYEHAIRRGGYAALSEGGERPELACDVDANCLQTRRIQVRPSAPMAGTSLASLMTGTLASLTLRDVERDGRTLEPSEVVVQPGDVLTFVGTAASFADAAPLFRAGAAPDVEQEKADHMTSHDEIVFRPRPGTGCGHLDQIHPVRPSAKGCEDCLRIGGQWVHLRICLSCGHVGCCDSSPNRHATNHHHETGHPIVRSMERGEAWGWCYVDEVML